MSVPADAFSRPLRRDAQRNRDRIVAAATEAFAAEGMQAQMDDIARRAGVGVGTVYRHFPTKEALVAELMRRKFAAIKRSAEEALTAEDPWDGFAEMMRRNASMMEQDAVLGDAIQRIPEAWATCGAERAETEEVSRAVIRRAQEAGALREDFDVDDIPMLMCGIGSAMAMSMLPRRDWRRHLEFLLDGLKLR